MSVAAITSCLAEATSPDSGKVSPLSVICLVVIALVIGSFAISAARKSSAENAEARSRFSQMSSTDVLALESRIIAFLYKHLGGETISALASEIQHSYALTKIFVERLVHDSKDVEILPRDSPADSAAAEAGSGYENPAIISSGTIIRLTEAGRTRYQRLPMEVKLNVDNGDVNIAYPFANLTSKSFVVDSYNSLATKYDEEAASALLKLEEAVKASQNKEAAEEFSEFVAQARAEKPNKVIMRALLDAIQKSVPAVASMTDVVIKIKDSFF